jgi:hypothetical protein
VVGRVVDGNRVADLAPNSDNSANLKLDVEEMGWPDLRLSIDKSVPDGPRDVSAIWH